MIKSGKNTVFPFLLFPLHRRLVYNSAVFQEEAAMMDEKTIGSDANEPTETLSGQSAGGEEEPASQVLKASHTHRPDVG